MSLSRKGKGFLLALGLALIAVVYGWRIHGLLEQGKPVFWLAELWAPAGMLSLGLVTCLEFFLPPKTPEKATAKATKTRKAA